MWLMLASANPSPEDSPGKAERHILDPFPHSSGAVTAELLGNSSDHPGFCLHAGTSHSAIQVRVKAKALCVCLCVQMFVHVHPLSSLPSLLHQLIFHVSFQNNLSRIPIYFIPAWLRYLQWSDLSVAFRKKPKFLNEEVKISCTAMIWPLPSLLNASLFSPYFSQTLNSLLSDVLLSLQFFKFYF